MNATSDTSTSTNSSQPSLINAGFIVVEVFDSESETAVSSAITKALGIPPESKPSNLQIFLFPPRPTAKSTSWKPEIRSLAEALLPTNPFNIDVNDCLSYVRSVRISLASPPGLPFILLLVHVFLDPAKLDLLDARNIIQQIAALFRLFVDRFNGLSALGANWSPRAASITWANLEVEEKFLDETASKVNQLEKLRDSGLASPDETKRLVDLIRKRLPLILADPAFPIGSYFMPATNVHFLVSQSTQPGFGHMRTPSVVWFSQDGAIIAQSGPQGQAEDLWMAQYFGSIGYTDIPLPVWFEGMLTWLVALNIWAGERELRAFGLDQQVSNMLLSPSRLATTQSIESSLSDASELGTTVAIEERKVRSAIRWSRYALDRIIAESGSSREISITGVQPYPSQMNVHYKQVNGLASLAKKSLQSAAGSLKDIEAEISKFQRHLSDLAALRSRDASLKLSTRLELITKVLVILTAALVVLTAVLAVKAVLGR